VTQTLPLAIYAQFDQDFDVALAISALFILVGAAILIGLKVFTWARARLDLKVPTRDFDVEVDSRRRRPRRSRSSARPAPERRRCCARRGARRRPTRRLVARTARYGSTATAASTCGPSSAPSATSSRSTRSSRICPSSATSASRRRAGDLLERLGIGELARAKPTELSGGERQRVALAARCP
jgi:ABC-type sugar transport system ATPase subunit